MRILLLSAYHASSHQYWCRGLQNHLAEYQWTELSLPPRHFNWRMRGNALSWAYNNSECLNQHYDLVIATSMVDLATLKGLVPKLAQVPALLYFHENQFAYPLSANEKNRLEPKMVSLYSALCAESLIFNSAYNRDSFLRGVNELLSAFPDKVPSGITQILESKSNVIPVPLNAILLSNKPGKKSLPQLKTESVKLVWNHRWEYDKGPEKLLSCIQGMDKNLKVRLHIIGQCFRQSPIIFEDIKRELQARDWLGEWGYIQSRESYFQLLAESDIVISTAIHDFQGLSILEAVQANCVPVVPDRLAYKEIFTEKYRYQSSPENPEAETLAMINQLTQRIRQVENDEGSENINLDDFSWGALASSYRKIIESTIADGVSCAT